MWKLDERLDDAISRLQDRFPRWRLLSLKVGDRRVVGQILAG